MAQFQTRVTSCRKIARGYFELQFKWKGAEPLPGQFLTLKCWEGESPLLRRPFALSSHDGEAAALIFQKRGPATDIMSRLKTGDALDIMGPLGNTFPQPGEDRRPLIVGGGIGTGPVLFLARYFSALGLRPLLVLGFRGKDYVPRVPLPVGCETVICTDDGSTGFRGTTVDYLMTRNDLGEGQFYGCGPHPMLEGLHRLAREVECPCSVSVEEVMACGIGACQGCAIEVTLPQKFLRVCKDGPVFDSRILKWN